MLFTELNTDVLLHVYGYLDLIDSVNLAETCTRLRDVAQLHCKRFEIFNLDKFLFRKPHNGIDATTVLKHIGPFIRVLAANLDANAIGSDVSTSIMINCVNVKALKIIEGSLEPSYNPFTTYSGWLRELSLTRISLSIRDLFLIDLTGTTTLEELDIRPCSDVGYKFTVDYGRVADIIDRNCNISGLCIPLSYGDFQYEIFKKLTCLQHLGLYRCNGTYLKEVSANLRMTALEKVELQFGTWEKINGFGEFLQKFGEKALHLKDLSIEDGNTYESLHFYTLPNVQLPNMQLPNMQLPNLTSIRLISKYPNLHRFIPKILPNLKDLDIRICTWNRWRHVDVPMLQIISLINNLKELKILHISPDDTVQLKSVMKDFLRESVLCQIFDGSSITRPAVTLRLFDKYEPDSFLQVELDFMARKWTWTTIEINYLTDFVERQSRLPFNYSAVGKVDDAKRFSGTVSDLYSVKDDAIKWIEELL